MVSVGMHIKCGLSPELIESVCHSAFLHPASLCLSQSVCPGSLGDLFTCPAQFSLCIDYRDKRLN